MRTFSASAIVAFCAIAIGPAFAQSTLEAPVGGLTPYTIDSGQWSNPNAEYIVVFQHTIQVQNSAWLRVYFDAATLQPIALSA